MIDRLHLDAPFWLLLLPLAALPWLSRARDARVLPWTALLPRDPAADWLLRLRKLLGSLAIAAIVTSLAGPYRAQTTVERIGRGSEIVLLLDRSRSMDQPFVETPRSINPYWQEKRQGALYSGDAAEGKGRIARAVLADFARGRPHDLIAYIVFSSQPITVLGFTQNQDMIDAAIAAGDVGRGLQDTDIGRALLAGAALWDDRPWRGSRTLVLVSDGGAQLDDETRARIAWELRRRQVAINFIYIRSYNSHGLHEQVAEDDIAKIPELALHHWLGSLGLSYHGYEAENATDLRQAIADIGARENAPIAYTETEPRRPFAPGLRWLAFAAVLGWWALLLPGWLAGRAGRGARPAARSGLPLRAARQQQGDVS
ncbi:vWA domain-containing protein [Derxia gummosa]|uniref:VWA domain-containing protein n=1 Tax=Derxia gummosa DSM 723 TaxID=1121388 RepID=A0A8B6X951_9BURK|nr:vWA domain-containing protein [Derxia gummosa]